jgi:hypothetical protein
MSTGTVTLHMTDNADNFLADAHAGPMYDAHDCGDVNSCSLQDAQDEAEQAYRASLVVAVTDAAAVRGLVVVWADTDPDSTDDTDPYDPDGPYGGRNADLAHLLWNEAHGNV